MRGNSQSTHAFEKREIRKITTRKEAVLILRNSAADLFRTVDFGFTEFERFDGVELGDGNGVADVVKELFV